jgi:hypothetical protein
MKIGRTSYLTKQILFFLRAGGTFFYERWGKGFYCVEDGFYYGLTSIWHAVFDGLGVGRFLTWILKIPIRTEKC